VWMGSHNKTSLNSYRTALVISPSGFGRAEMYAYIDFAIMVVIQSN